MKKYLVIIIPLVFLSGCYTKCGLHQNYYCKCTEYYDASGQYVQECPQSIPTQTQNALDAYNKKYGGAPSPAQQQPQRITIP